MIEQSILLHVQQSIYYTSSCGQSICNLNLILYPINPWVSAGLWTNHSSPGVQAVVEEAEVGAAVLHRHGAELQPVPPLVQRAPVRGVPLSRNTSIGNKYFSYVKYFCLAADLSDLVVVSEEAEAGV